MRSYKKVQDLKRPVLFTLTKKNIECAIRKDEKRCAWAEALVASDPSIDFVRVKNSVVHIARADRSVSRGMLSSQMKKAIRAFDGEIHGKDFADFCPPGAYAIMPPASYQTLKAKRDSSNKHRKPEQKKYPANGRGVGHKVSARNQYARSSAEDFREAQLAKSKASTP